MQILVMIPTYNEHENLETLTKRILDLGLDLGIVVIDDNSPDGTGELADRLAAADKRISVLHRPAKEGIGKAYLAGYRYAVEKSECEYLIQMDADLSHDPAYIPELLAKMKDCDFVTGSRYSEGRIRITNWPLVRLILSYGASLYVRLFSGTDMSDPTSGFKCFRRKVVERIVENGIMSDGYASNIEVNYMCRKMGFRACEIPIVFYDRSAGSSKMCKLSAVLGAIAIVWKLKFKRFK